MRPVLFDQAHSGRASAKQRREACRAEHPSIPWKAYLASREFQNLASDLADAVFAPALAHKPIQDAERPTSLTQASSGTRGNASAGLLAPVLQGAPDTAKKQAPGFALAA